MAQSYALKHFLRGLLRIRTGEPDAESLPQTKQEPDGEPARARRGRPPNKPEVNLGTRGPAQPTYLFDFGRQESGGFEQLTAEQVQLLFDKIVAPLGKAKRKEWQEANRAGMAELCEGAKSTWLQICKAIEA